MTPVSNSRTIVLVIFSLQIIAGWCASEEGAPSVPGEGVPVPEIYTDSRQPTQLQEILQADE